MTSNEGLESALELVKAIFEQTDEGRAVANMRVGLGDRPTVGQIIERAIKLAEPHKSGVSEADRLRAALADAVQGYHDEVVENVPGGVYMVGFPEWYENAKAVLNGSGTVIRPGNDTNARNGVGIGAEPMHAAPANIEGHDSDTAQALADAVQAFRNLPGLKDSPLRSTPEYAAMCAAWSLWRAANPSPERITAQREQRLLNALLNEPGRRTEQEYTKMGRPDGWVYVPRLCMWERDESVNPLPRGRNGQ